MKGGGCVIIQETDKLLYWFGCLYPKRQLYIYMIVYIVTLLKYTSN